MLPDNPGRYRGAMEERRSMLKNIILIYFKFCKFFLINLIDICKLFSFMVWEKILPQYKGQKMAQNPTVARMSEYTKNCLQVSSEQAIQDLQEFLKENPDFNKVFLIAVNTKEREFFYAWFKGRMLSSEAIAVLHLAMDDQKEALR